MIAENVYFNQAIFWTLAKWGWFLVVQQTRNCQSYIKYYPQH